MTTSDSRKCALCGSTISDNNPDGIGFGCRAAWQASVKDTFFAFGGALEVHAAKVAWLVPRFLEASAEVKFRSAFRKSFYASTKERWASPGPRFSNRQLEIMEGINTFEKGTEAENEAAYQEWNRVRSYSRAIEAYAQDLEGKEKAYAETLFNNKYYVAKATEEGGNPTGKRASYIKAVKAFWDNAPEVKTLNEAERQYDKETYGAPASTRKN